MFHPNVYADGSICLDLLNRWVVLVQALSIDWLIDWCISRLMDWLIGCLVDWLIGGMIDWLIDWLVSVKLTKYSRCRFSKYCVTSLSTSDYFGRLVSGLMFSPCDFCSRWSPSYDVASILTSIQSLLDAPNPNSPANSLAAQLYQTDRREYEKRVAAIVEESWLDAEGEQQQGQSSKDEIAGETADDSNASPWSVHDDIAVPEPHTLFIATYFERNCERNFSYYHLALFWHTFSTFWSYTLPQIGVFGGESAGKVSGFSPSPFVVPLIPVWPERNFGAKKKVFCTLF